jgi:prophage maintenance system killer protein
MLSMLMFIEQNGMQWQAPPQGEIVEVIEGLAAGEISEDEFVEWVVSHTE